MKYNLICYSPGGYGPWEKPNFWGEAIKLKGKTEEDRDDELQEAGYDLHHNVDYGCFCMTRKEAEELVKDLQKILAHE